MGPVVLAPQVVYFRSMRPAVFLSMALVGCGLGSSSIRESIGDTPWRGGDLDRVVIRARELVDRDDGPAALQLVDGVISSSPRHVDAHRVRQDVLRARGRLGIVLREAEQRVAAWKDDPYAWYLHGRVQRSDAGKRADFERVVSERPESFWGWLGLAFTLRTQDPARGLAVYQDLYERSDKHPLVATALASTLRQAGQLDAALAVYEELRGAPGMAGVGELGIAETHLLAGKRERAWPALLVALRLRPEDPGVRRAIHTLLAHGVSELRVRRLLDVLYESPELLQRFGSGVGASLLATLFERAGQLPAARAALAPKRGEAKPTAAELRQERRLRLMTGDVAGFLRHLKAHTPTAIVRDERNRLRGRWVALLDGPWMTTEAPLADAERAHELCRALLRVGLLEAADIVATTAIAQHPTSDDLRSTRDEARRQLAFESAVRETIYRGYGGEGGDLDATLEKLRIESKRILGKDVIGDPGRSSIPLVGQMVDPFIGTLAEHLATYNRHLVLGQRWAGTVEGLLLTRLCLRELEPSDDLPLRGRCMQVVGDDRRIQALGGVLGGDLAGVALLDHYVVDYDAVRDWATAIHGRRVIAREDSLALLDDPLPESVDALEPVDVEWRLSLLSEVPDDELDAAVFDMICAHERAHLVDSFYFLPPGDNLLRVLGLVVAHGFNALSVESEMEGRAEAGALVVSPHTRLVLAHIAGFLNAEGADESPHAIGFRSLAEQLNERLAKTPELAEFARASRWHLVPPERMREFGRQILQR